MAGIKNCFCGLPAEASLSSREAAHETGLAEEPQATDETDECEDGCGNQQELEVGCSSRGGGSLLQVSMR